MNGELEKVYDGIESKDMDVRDDERHGVVESSQAPQHPCHFPNKLPAILSLISNPTLPT
jgi:hypothetical protein